MVEGRLNERNGTMSILADSVLPMEHTRERLTRSVNITLPSEAVNDDLLNQLLKTCQEFAGPCDLIIRVESTGDAGHTDVVRSRSIRVNPCDELLRRVDALTGVRETELTTLPANARLRA